MLKIWDRINEHTTRPLVRAERPQNSFWPSSAGVSQVVDGKSIRIGGCRRQQFFRWYGYPKDAEGHTFASLWKMQIGKYTENILEPMFRSMGIFLGREVPVSITRASPVGDYMISGSIDFLLGNSTMPVLGAELKTKSGFNYAIEGIIEPTDKKPLAPDPENVIQVLPYLDWLRMQGVEQPAFQIMYLSREADTNEHLVTLDPATRHAVYQNDKGVGQYTELTPEVVYQDWDGLAKHIVDRVIPERDYELVWSRDTVVWKLQHGKLNKTDTKSVEDKIKKGDTSPKLLDKGDWQCAFCDYCKGCWTPYPGFEARQVNKTGHIVQADPSTGSMTPPTAFPQVVTPT